MLLPCDDVLPPYDLSWLTLILVLWRLSAPRCTFVLRCGCKVVWVGP